MKNILLDVNIIVDICAEREPYAVASAQAVAKGLYEGVCLWAYMGSLQTLEFVLSSELLRLAPGRGETLTQKECTGLARKLLEKFGQRIQWLAALAGEANVFYCEDPEGEQLIRALDRFARDEIVLLTRDKVMLNKAPERTITPEAYCSQPTACRKLDFIDLKTQQDILRPHIEQNVHRVLHHGQYIMGPEIKELEQKLAEYVGVKHCITVASGTDSLEIALRALGIGPGDEVITVPFTWISTAEVICQVGARPVFIDIDPATYNMNVDLLETAITPQTKAIMPVSLFGQMPDYERINAIAAQHGNIPVIEDGAQSLGATQRGRRSCGVTLVGSTSFFPAKPFGCYGDGGALFTNDDDLAARMRAIRTHGGLQRHYHPYIGMNGRLDTLHAAVLLAKFPSFQSEVEARGRIGGRYTELLRGLCPVPEVVDGNTHVYAQYTIRTQNRDVLAAHLKAQGIPSAVYYPKCLHEQPAFAFCGYTWGDFPEAEKASREVLSLPMHPYIDMGTQESIAKAIAEAIS